MPKDSSSQGLPHTPTLTHIRTRPRTIIHRPLTRPTHPACRSPIRSRTPRPVVLAPLALVRPAHGAHAMVLVHTVALAPPALARTFALQPQPHAERLQQRPQLRAFLLVRVRVGGGTTAVSHPSPRSDPGTQTLTQKAATAAAATTTAAENERAERAEGQRGGPYAPPAPGPPGTEKDRAARTPLAPGLARRRRPCGGESERGGPARSCSLPSPSLSPSSSPLPSLPYSPHRDH
ncbi:hypothetical protein SERLADRAFT_443017 [Serpula lacrymans var. lacrymans S7.9]|uniref:Uncharacterized protein n=1 Tax=Serpula lacrymans var. lacrymans (strain S7.9) TaxID=578457 RepID=F8PBB0_SERL9|nr:uncharacterized protein SERLADRAFT_443017 [Serpula lacrymans var. lacrymans S7.9]EGO19550.1 hypothetical protein SERLADRAFT_443017 [Serpula lacrymans var. lacrymans S7.9]